LKQSQESGIESRESGINGRAGSESDASVVFGTDKNFCVFPSGHCVCCGLEIILLLQIFMGQECFNIFTLFQ